jgi:hypothetical protein
MATATGSLSIAAQAFARALELDPDRPRAPELRQVLRELERYADSEQELRLAVAQSEDDARWINLAETLVAEHNRRSRATARRRARKEPAHPEALGVKGGCCAGAGEEGGRTSRRRRRPPIPSRLSSWRAHLAAVTRQGARPREALRGTPGHPWAMAVLGDALIREASARRALSI